VVAPGTCLRKQQRYPAAAQIVIRWLHGISIAEHRAIYGHMVYQMRDYNQREKRQTAAPGVPETARRP
jgi:hypothetical protein